MSGRDLSVADRAIARFDAVLRAACGSGRRRQRPSPAVELPAPPLSPEENRRAAGLMRVNHTGEVCAQALYLGQAFVARSPQVRESLDRAAAEEADHLHWCAERLEELDARQSLLNPLWFCASLGIGVAVAAAGDRWSLGFVEETENQVVAHLERHLARLPADDARSRAIVSAMRADEARHAATAAAGRGSNLPWTARKFMAAQAKIMTTVAYWI